MAGTEEPNSAQAVSESRLTTLQGARVWVTGASGFVGQNAVRALLAAGAEVHALVRAGHSLAQLGARLHLHEVRLCDLDALRALAAAQPPTHVLHGAAERGHPVDAAARLRAWETSVLGTATLLEALRDVPYWRFVHLGSTLEYGPRNYPIPETEALRPATARGAAKAAASLVCLAAAAEGKPVVIVRPFSVFGPWESEVRFIPTVFRCVERGERIALTRLGIHHDHVFVEDVVDACLRALTQPVLPGEVFHAGTGVQHSNESLVEALFAVCGTRVPVDVGAHPGHPPDTAFWAADFSQSRARLGWRPTHTLEQGLAKTWHWRQSLSGRKAT